MGLVPDLPPKDEEYIYSVDGSGPVLSIEELEKSEVQVLVYINRRAYTITVSQLMSLMLRKKTP